MTLRELRLNKGYTLTQVAELSGIHCTTLSRYENGNTYPRVKNIKKLAQVYGIHPQQILEVLLEKKSPGN